MAISVTRWERRAGTTLEAFGDAAFDYCRASRTTPGMQSCRFYWVNADVIVTLSDADSAEVFDRPATPDTAKTAFTLIDLARQVGNERWAAPSEAQLTYRTAGR